MERTVELGNSVIVRFGGPTLVFSVASNSLEPRDVASCDYRGGPDRAVFCTQTQISASSCLSTTVDATHTLGAYPCLCDANLLQLMDRCAVDENLAKCGYQTTAVPWPTRLRSTCQDFSLNPVSLAAYPRPRAACDWAHTLHFKVLRYSNYAYLLRN